MTRNKRIANLILATSEYFEHGSFDVSSGKLYNVKPILTYLEMVHYPISKVNIRRLIWKSFANYFVSDEPIGSKEFVSRANISDLNYPILVVRSNKGDIAVGDGNHRLYKAYKLGMKYIKAYVIDEDLLERINNES